MKRLQVTIIVISLLLFGTAPVFAGARGELILPDTSTFLHIGLAELGSYQIQNSYYNGNKNADYTGMAGYVDHGEAEMLQDWPLLLGLDINLPGAREDLLYLVEKATTEELENIAQAFVSGELDGTLRPNQAAQALVKSQNEATLKYLFFLRNINRAGADANDMWSYRRIDRSPGIDSMLEETLEGYLASTIPELKIRYAYQYMSLLFFSAEHATNINFFEYYVNQEPDNPVKEWCRSHYGGSLYARQDYSGALAAFALVMHRSSWYAQSAKSSLELTESAVRYHIYKDYWDGNAQLSNAEKQQRAQEYDVRYQAAREELFANAMEKISTPAEQAYMQSAICFLNNDITGSLLSVLQQTLLGIPTANPEEYLVQIVGNRMGHLFNNDAPADLPLELEETVLAVGATRPAPAFWYLAAAHLALMRKDAERADSYIALAIAHHARRDFPEQLLITSLLYEIRLGNGDRANQDRLGELLLALQTLSEAEAAKNPAPVNHDKNDWQELYGIEEDIYSKPVLLHKIRRGILEELLLPQYKKTGYNEGIFFCAVILNRQFYPNNENGGPFVTLGRSYIYYWSSSFYDPPPVLSDIEMLEKVIAAFASPQNALERYFVSQATDFNLNVLNELLGVNLLESLQFYERRACIQLH